MLARLSDPVVSEFTKDFSVPLLLKEGALRESVIVTNQQAKAFLLRAIPGVSAFVKIKMIYRATEDDWRAENFHRQCNGKGATITIIRSDAQKVFGGFTMVSWSSMDKGDQNKT